MSLPEAPFAFTSKAYALVTSLPTEEFQKAFWLLISQEYNSRELYKIFVDEVMTGLTYAGFRDWRTVFQDKVRDKIFRGDQHPYFRTSSENDIAGLSSDHRADPDIWLDSLSEANRFSAEQIASDSDEYYTRRQRRLENMGMPKLNYVSFRVWVKRKYERFT